MENLKHTDLPHAVLLDGNISLIVIYLLEEAVILFYKRDCSHTVYV